MHQFSRFVNAVALSAGLFALAACSGAGSPAAPVASADVSSSSQAFADRAGGASPVGAVQRLADARTRPLLFVADAENNDIDIFAENNPKQPLSKITSGISDPEETAVDRDGNLYVANLAANDVTVYAPPYTGAPTATYSQGLTYPFSVTVARDGTVFVSANPNGTVGQVVVYPAGSTSPSRTLAIEGYVEGVALDAAGALYVAFNAPSGYGRVRKYERGADRGTDLPFKLGLVSGLAFDGSGNLAIEDQIAAAVDVFAPGAKTPTHVFNNGGNGFGDPVSLAFDRNHDRLYIGDGQNGVVDILSYPSGKTLQVLSASFGRVHGVATNPPAIP